LYHESVASVNMVEMGGIEPPSEISAKKCVPR